jgi:hypothetical protein
MDTLDDGLKATRLQVAGVQTPILTQVTRKSARGMTVEQALPFLQLRTQVWDDAQQSSRIESVSVVVYDGVPRLVLDLTYDDELETPAAEPETRRAHAGVVRPRLRLDETRSYEREPSARTTIPYEQPVREPSRESTQVFSTQPAAQPKPEQLPLDVAGLKLSVMEQELLQPKDFVYHVRTNWERAKPHLRRAGWQAQAWTFRAYRWALPRVIALSHAARDLTVRVAQRAMTYVAQRARASVGAQHAAPQRSGAERGE